MNRLLSSLIAIALTLSLQASPPSEDDVEDADIRENPELAADSAASVDASSFRRYPFLHLGANKVKTNGADLSALAAKFEAARKGEATVSIVQIGDSHIQPDGNTGRTRKLLQKDYGDAGRGLITPFRIAGTNQPLDYKISTSTAATTSKLMRMPWATNMGLTGIGVHPEMSKSQFTISADRPFNTIDVIADGQYELIGVSSGDFTTEDIEGAKRIRLSRETPYITLTFNSPNRDFTLFGFSTFSTDDELKQRPGVVYHSIGNNGATYSLYSGIGNFGRDLKALQPDLVVLAMGTNEAFGKTSDTTFRMQVDRLVTDIKRNNPDALIVLSTPSECQRSAYTYTRRKGRRRRSGVRTYQVNNNVARMRNVLLRYGEEKNIPVYDFYDVAGGAGSSAKWLQNKLLSADRIHRTWTGYYLEGELWHKALQNMVDEANAEAKAKAKAKAKEKTMRPPKRTSKAPAKTSQGTRRSTKSHNRTH